MESKTKLIEKVTEKISLLNQTEKIEEIIKNNKIEFEVNKKTYRVSKPTNAQTIAVRKARNLKFYELLNSPAYKLKEVLIAELKENGYDIIAKEAEIKELGLQISDIQEKVAPIPTENKEAINNYKKEVKELEKKQSKIVNRISELLEFSVEQALEEFSNLYLIFSILEEEVEDKWQPAFKTYIAFLDSDESELLLDATYNMSMLVFRSKI